MCGLLPSLPIGGGFFFNVPRAATSSYKQSSKVMQDDSRLRHPLNPPKKAGFMGKRLAVVLVFVYSI